MIQLQPKQQLEAEDIITSTKVKNFLNKYPSKNTKLCYKSQMSQFFQHLNQHPDSYLKDPRLLENGQKIPLLDGYKTDITDYWNFLQIKAPKTISVRMAVLKTFFEDNYIEFERKFWRDFRTRGKGNANVIEDITPTKEQIRAMLNLGDVKSRAIILALSSSGLRIEELCKIRIKDVDFNSVPVKVTIRARIAKNKNNATTFFSSEAVTAIKSWLKIRDDYLETSSKSLNFTRKMPDGTNVSIDKPSVDDRLFPMCTDSVRSNCWDSLLRKAHLDDRDETGRHRFRLHSLRKYFINQISKGPGGVPLSEQLSNHVGYLGGYHQITDLDTLKQLYLQSEQYLIIDSTAEESNKHSNRRAVELEKELTDLKHINYERNDIMAQQQFEINDLRKLVDQMMKTIDIDLDQQIAREGALDEEQRPTHISTLTRKDGSKFQVGSPL
jgi:integrase